MAYYKFAVSIARGAPIDLYNEGDMKRDFTYVDDAVDAVARVMERPATPDPSWRPTDPDPGSSSAPFRIYNVGNSRAEPLDNLVLSLERCLGKKAQRRLLPMQPGDVRETQADVGDLERDFGWRPSTPLEEGIKRFSDWFRSYHQ